MNKTLDQEKQKALDVALTNIRKEFGNEALMKLGEKNNSIVETGVISTGVLPLDIALGVGGVPRGRIIEIFGPEASGKTTICLKIVAEAQKKGGVAAFIDVEHALDPEYSAKLGVDIPNLLLAQPSSGEEALSIVEKLAQSGAVDVIVLDSVAALVPKAELEGEMGDSHVGLQARLMSQALRKLTSLVAKTRTLLVMTNQLRQKIGVFYGNPETTPGGLALKFYASVRLDVRAKEKIKEGDSIIGHRGVVKVIKNKVAPPFKVAEFEMRHGHGVVREACILSEGEVYEVVDKAGIWYTFGEVRLGQGRDQSIAHLKENPELAQKIEDAIRKKVFSQEPGQVETVSSSTKKATQKAA